MGQIRTIHNLCLIIGFIFIITACHSKPPSEVIMLGDPPTPEQVFRGFYNDYLDYATQGDLETYFQQEIYRQSNYLDKDFVRTLESSTFSANPREFDPVLCSNEVPSSLKIINAETEEDRIILEVETNLKNHTFFVVLTPIGQAYFLHEIRCD
jgi:hypothetical protein